MLSWQSPAESGINHRVQGELVLSVAEGSPCWGAKKIKLGQILTELFYFKSMYVSLTQLHFNIARTHKYYSGNHALLPPAAMPEACKLQSKRL